MGNNYNNVFTTLGASSHAQEQREENDYYATNPITITDLFEVEKFQENIWEPACGGGHLAQAMVNKGKIVKSTDLINRGYGTGGIDFFKETEVFNGDIVTNPPYSMGMEFIKKGLDLIKDGSKIAMFLKIQFLEGQKRGEFFKKYPPKTVYIYIVRQGCQKGGDFSKYKGSAIAYAWYIWEKGFQGQTKLKWIQGHKY